MKKVLMGSIIAISSVFTLAACANVGAASTDSASYNSTQNKMQKKSHPHAPFAQLNLTTSQQAQIKAIRENESNVRMQNHDAIMKILTAEQREKLATLKEERKGKRSGQGQGKGMKKGEHAKQHSQP